MSKYRELSNFFGGKALDTTRTEHKMHWKMTYKYTVRKVRFDKWYVLRLEGKERTEVTFLGQQNVSCVFHSFNERKEAFYLISKGQALEWMSVVFYVFVFGCWWLDVKEWKWREPDLGHFEKCVCDGRGRNRTEAAVGMGSESLSNGKVFI